MTSKIAVVDVGTFISETSFDHFVRECFKAHHSPVQCSHIASDVSLTPRRVETPTELQEAHALHSMQAEFNDMCQEDQDWHWR